ncbi:MAG: N-acetylmuramoyl-L-alanine amidase [Lachnospiraceae bacterium]|nr:N-acetylmuramoyl-L-alanine amidase [Lachnospiraceae bacterium]
MEKRVFWGISLICAAAMVVYLGLLLELPGFMITAIERQAVLEQGVVSNRSVLALLHPTDPYVVLADPNTGELHHIRLELPPEVRSRDIIYEDDYHTRHVTITIPGIGESYFADHPMIGISDNIVDLTYGSESGVGVIDIDLDGIYEFRHTQEDKYIYLDFLDPHDVYDQVWVIDAGHGGSDVGANIEEAGIYEKDLTLQMVEKLKDICDANDKNIGVYYTRLDDSDLSLEERVEMANSIDADLFLSVHINSTSSGRMSGIHGTSVMYLVSDPTGRSLTFAANLLDKLLQSLGSLSKGTVAGDDIYIIRYSEVPVALVEVGFITNTEELRLMQSDDYQQKAAQAMYDAMLKTADDLANGVIVTEPQEPASTEEE